MFDSLTGDGQATVGRSAPVEATIKLADACSFHLVIGERSPRVHCYVPGLKLPFAHGQKVRGSRRGDGAGPNEREYLVIRDLQGRLLLAGGGGSRMLDVPCVPPELKASRVDGACGVYDPWPDAGARCTDVMPC